MNTKLSGCQLVTVPIERVGRNKFPFIENLRGRIIKFIDAYSAELLPGTTTAGVTDFSDMYITIMDEHGNTRLQSNLPLARLDYEQTLGVRQPICSKISLADCYIDNQEAGNVGKMAAFVFWFDLPEFSQRNMTTNLLTDYITIPLTTTTRYNKLPELDRIAGKRVRRILLAMPNVTPDLSEGIYKMAIRNLYLTLRKGSYMVCENVPLMLLYQIAMLDKSEFQNILFDLQSSYITIGGAGNVDPDDYIGKSVFLNIQYEK